jgi:hypothetical protein
MFQFLQKHRRQIVGVLSGFDRLVFRGYLRGIAYAEGLQAFLHVSGVLLKDFKSYAQKATETVKAASLAAALASARPIINLNGPKEEKLLMAQSIAKKDGIKEGLVCVFKTIEPCYSFNVRRDPEKGRLALKRERRKCQFLYHYFRHPQFGLMHVRLQTWFPFDLQVWVNGRNMLAQQLQQAGLGYVQKDNAITQVEDFPRAQAMLWGQSRMNWLRLLNPLIRTVHPALPGVFDARPMAYYWSVHQSEWATDFIFRSPQYLAKLYSELVPFAMRYFDSHSVMRFLGHRVPNTGAVHGCFKGKAGTEFEHRPEGICVRHYAAGNALKMYDKLAQILRTENTMTNPSPFKAFRAAEGGSPKAKRWLPLRKSIADLSRRARVSHAANQRYSDALVACQNPRRLEEDLGKLCGRVCFHGKRIRGFRPLDPQDQQLLAAISRGEHAINGFRNRDLRSVLYPKAQGPADLRKASGRITRKLQLLRAHGLIKKVPHTHRYQLTQKGQELAIALIAVTKLPLAQLVQEAS